MTRSDIGLADAYIDGDFSFDDEHEGLFNFVRVSEIYQLFNLLLNKFISVTNT